MLCSLEHQSSPPVMMLIPSRRYQSPSHALIPSQGYQSLSPLTQGLGLLELPSYFSVRALSASPLISLYRKVRAAMDSFAPVTKTTLDFQMTELANKLPWLCLWLGPASLARCSWQHLKLQQSSQHWSSSRECFVPMPICLAQEPKAQLVFPLPEMLASTNRLEAQTKLAEVIQDILNHPLNFQALSSPQACGSIIKYACLSKTSPTIAYGMPKPQSQQYILPLGTSNPTSRHVRRSIATHASDQCNRPSRLATTYSLNKMAKDWNLALIGASLLLQTVSCWPLPSSALSSHPWIGLTDPQLSKALLLGQMSVLRLFPTTQRCLWFAFVLVRHILPMDGHWQETWHTSKIASLSQTCFEPKCQKSQKKTFNLEKLRFFPKISSRNL